MFLPPPTGPDLTPEEAGQQKRNEAYALAIDLLDKGMAPMEVKKRLLDKGYDTETAFLLVNEAVRARSEPLDQGPEYRQALKSAGQKNMAIGGIIAVIGLVVTLATFAAATGEQGGRYVIAWGAVIFGGIQFFRGLSQVSAAEK
jgi:hypothetical protein